MERKLKILICGDIGVLTALEEQAIIGKYFILNHNALLFQKSHALSVTQYAEGICFGKYYGEIPPYDSRFADKVDLFDVVVEIGENRMTFLCEKSLYMRVHNAPSLKNLLKTVDSEFSALTKNQKENSNAEGPSD